MKDFLKLREILDSSTRKIEEEEMIEEMIFPNVPETWHEDLVKVGVKKNTPVKELIKELENFEECERKIPAQHRNPFKLKKNVWNKKGRNHEWKDCPENPRSKVKKRKITKSKRILATKIVAQVGNLAM